MRENEEILFDASGHLSDETIAFYGEALIYRKENELPDAVLDHAEGCIVCKQKIVSTCDILREHEEEKRLKERKYRISWRLALRIAAAILIIVGSTIVLFEIKENTTENVNLNTIAEDTAVIDSAISPEIAANDSIFDNAAGENEKLLAENYAESELFETLTKTVLRSDINLEILSPESNESFNKGQEIPFFWKADQDAKYTIKLYNNREVEPIYEFKNLDVELILSENLEQGLYYWKLESEEDLLFVGKFFVRKR
jgi:hypothetical protein